MPPGWMFSTEAPESDAAGREASGADVGTAVARAKQGDEEAIRFLYERFSARVYAHARGIVRNPHDAEDITQLVFTRMLTALRSYEQRSAPFSAWLLRITHNAAIDHLRRTAPVMLDDNLVACPPAEPETQRAALLSALATLPRVQREVVLLRHLGGYSPGEIASRLGRSENAVHGLHHRGRRALRLALTQTGSRPMTAAA